MRSDEMEIGGTYVLRGRANRKVTVLETSAEVRSAARVRVRFENGVKAGSIAEIPSRRIARPRREKEAADERPRRRVGQTPPALAERPAQVGDTVTLHGDETGLLWTVEAIEGANASLRSEIFGRPSLRELGVDRLQVHEAPKGGRLVHLIGEEDADAGAEDGHLDEKQWIAEHLSPRRPKRELDRILDQLVFSQGCLRIYGRRLAPNLRGGAVAERLRQEIRHKGYLVRGEELPGPEYARLRVRGRFDIVLNSPSPPDEAVMVNWIHFPAKQKLKWNRQRRRRAA